MRKPPIRNTPIECKRCKKTVMAVSVMQKYCSECSIIVDRDRKAAWAATHGRKLTKEEVKRRYDNARERRLIIGNESSKANRIEMSYKASPNPYWILCVKFPFTYSLSKNAIWRMGRQGHVFLRQESRANRDALTLLLKNAISQSSVRVANNKLWIEIYAEKPDMRGDAINLIDSVCDAVKDATNLDDRWYCIRGVDWSIVKDNPHIIIKISQESNEDVRACSYCGRILPLDKFLKNRSDKLGVTRTCKECSRIGDRQKKRRNAA